MTKREDEFVTVAVVHDPVYAEMAKELLAREGIEASAPGVNHSALFGRMGQFIDIAIQVPHAHAARARDLLETLEERGEIVDDAPEARALERDPGPLPGEGPYRSRPDEELSRGSRSRRGLLVAVVVMGVFVFLVMLPALIARRAPSEALEGEPSSQPPDELERD